MIETKNLSLAFGKDFLFKDVNIKFTPENCYGIIGANGSGKSTFLKILAGDIECTTGEIIVTKNNRIAFLQQDQNAFDEFKVMDTVIFGHKELYELLKARDYIYSKKTFTEEDGLKAGEIEEKVGILNGYNAEYEAGYLLSKLGIPESGHEKLMKDIDGKMKVRVLLAQAIFNNPDILLLDEPTNNLDIKTIDWLENFLYDFKNTVIVVSHDRHFLNRVCTHIVDVNYQTLNVYVGNYDFWYDASLLRTKQMSDKLKKNEEKVDELKKFVLRFSANASKSKQATSRKRLIEKLTLEELPVSSRRSPYIAFTPERECGNVVLTVKNLSYTQNNETLIKDMDFTINRKDKICLIGNNALAKTAFFDIITGALTPDTGEVSWGQTITHIYLPKDHTTYFETDDTIMEWLKRFANVKMEETVLRGFLGRMLFKQDDAFKKVNILSGGERVRCMLSKTMLSNANCLLLDEPNNHLDLESITELNNALIKFNGVIIFASHDHQFVNTVANRVIEFTPGGIIDRAMSFDEYLENEDVKALRDKLYASHLEIEL
jgi:ATPase subunit of ABC transporter with duplicated ATPase domains